LERRQHSRETKQRPTGSCGKAPRSNIEALYQREASMMLETTAGRSSPQGATIVDGYFV